MGQAFRADLAILILFHLESNVNRKNSHGGTIMFTSVRRKLLLPGVFTNNLEIGRRGRKKTHQWVVFQVFFLVFHPPLCLRVCFQLRKQKTVLRDRIHPLCL